MKPTKAQEEFYKTYYPLAKKYTEGTGLLPETLLAQMAQESGWGKTASPQTGYNVFGIKGKGNVQDTIEEINGVKYKTKSSFRGYNSVDEAMKDYVREITSNPRFKDAVKYKTPQEQIKHIAKGGYATSQKYGDVVSSHVNTFNKFKGMAEPNKDELMFEDIDTKAELMAELERLKKKAKTGALTSQEMNESMALKKKAAYLIKDRKDLAVFTEDLAANVFAPQVYAEMNQYKLDYENEIKGLKKKLVTAKPEEIDALQQEIQNKENQYKENYTKAKGIVEKYETAAGYKPKTVVNRTKESVNYEKEVSHPDDYLKSVDDLFQSYYDTKYELSLQGDKRALEYFDKQPPYTPTQKQGMNMGAAGAAGFTGYKTPGMDVSNQSTKSFYSTNGYRSDASANIIDMDTNTGEIFDSRTASKNPIDYQKAIDEDTALINRLKQPKQETAYEPDFMPKRDIAGYLMDIGRVGLGIKGAMEKLPEYTPSAMFSEYMKDAQQRQDMGLSADEIAAAKNMAERGFAYDVKNIRNLSGGSAGVALGNLGRANQQLQDSYSGIAAADQAARRANRQQFYQAAGQAENLNQFMFNIDNERAMLNKQAGAGLVNDAISNMLNRKQYEDTHGKGSQYYEYMKELTLGERDNRQILNDANEQRRLDAMAEIQARIDANTKALNGKTGMFTDTQSIESAVKNNQLPNQVNNPDQVNNPANVGTGIMNTVVQNPNDATVQQMQQQGFGDVQQENVVDTDVNNKQMKTAAGTNVTGQGILGSVYSGKRELGVDNKDALKVMEQRGDKIYEQVKNTPEFREKVQTIMTDYDNQIANLQAQLRTPGLTASKMKQLEAKLKQLENDKSKDIDKAHREQEKWADSQFDESGNYIGNK